MISGRWSASEVVEGFHLAHAVSFVVATSLLGDDERTAYELAARVGLEPAMLRPLLELLASRTDLVVRGERGYRRGPGLGPLAAAEIDQYVGAYGPNAAALAEVMALPARGRDLVDRERHAAAFARAVGAGRVVLPPVLEALDLGPVLDLGCGAGDMLVEMATRDHGMVGWGVDASPAMVRLAKERAAVAGVSDGRLRFIVGDVAEPEVAIPEDAASTAGVVTASSLLNGLFWPDGSAAAEWLLRLRTKVPDRVMVVADYYGALGHVDDPLPRTALHDWVQLISGQGIPPPDLEGWTTVYAAAGCALLHAMKDGASGSFVHVVRLGPA